MNLQPNLFSIIEKAFNSTVLLGTSLVLGIPLLQAKHCNINDNYCEGNIEQSNTTTLSLVIIIN